MGKFIDPPTDVFDAAKAPHHPWENDFKDIPSKWGRLPGRLGGWVYRPDGPGVLATPVLPSALALHVQLCGYRPVEEERKVFRVDPIRGGRGLTSPGIWQDVTEPVPEGNPVNTVLQTAASEQMTPAEMHEAGQALMEQARLQAG